MSDNNTSDNTSDNDNTFISKVESIIDQSVPSSMVNSLHLSETSETSETSENSSKNIDTFLDDLNTDMSDNKDIMEMSCIEPEVSSSDSIESESDSEESDNDESDSEESDSDESYSEEDELKNSFQIIILKEQHNEFPWSIRCVGYILIVMYIIKLFIALCMLSGCSCPRNCICLS